MQIKPKKKRKKIECSHLAIVNGSIVVLTPFDMWCSSQQFVNVSTLPSLSCEHLKWNFNKNFEIITQIGEFLKFFFCLFVKLEKRHLGMRWRFEKINISWETFSSNNRISFFLFSFLQPLWRRTFVIIWILNGD